MDLPCCVPPGTVSWGSRPVSRFVAIETIHQLPGTKMPVVTEIAALKKVAVLAKMGSGPFQHKISVTQHVGTVRDLKCEMHVLFNEQYPCSTLGGDGAEDRHEALKRCLEKLRPQDRELLMHRYAKSGTLNEFAAHAGRSVGGLKVTLHRLRNALLECMQRQSSAQEGLS